MQISESAVGGLADELTLAKVLGKEEEAFGCFDEIGFKTLALEQDANVGNRVVVLDEASPATSSSLDVDVFADSSPSDSEVQSEVVNDGGRGALWR